MLFVSISIFNLIEWHSVQTPNNERDKSAWAEKNLSTHSTLPNPCRARARLSMPAQWLALVSRELRYSNRIFLTLPSYWNSTTHQTICNCLLLWAIRKEMFFVWSGLKRQDSQQWRIIFIDSFIQISTLCTLIVNLVFEQTFVPSSVAAKLPRQVVPPLPWWQFYSWRPGRVGGKGLTTVLVNPSLSSLLWLFQAQISA